MAPCLAHPQSSVGHLGSKDTLGANTKLCLTQLDAAMTQLNTKTIVIWWDISWGQLQSPSIPREQYQHPPGSNLGPTQVPCWWDNQHPSWPLSRNYMLSCTWRSYLEVFHFTLCWNQMLVLISYHEDTPLVLQLRPKPPNMVQSIPWSHLTSSCCPGNQTWHWGVQS